MSYVEDENTVRLIIIIALLHAIADYKYNYSMDDLKMYLIDNKYETDKIIEKISYNKRSK